MKIAIAQFAPIWEQKKLSMDKAEKWILEAARHGADYIFFPELSLTGFSMKIAQIMDSKKETEEFVSTCAKKYGIGIGMGYVPFSLKKGKNCYLILDKNGNRILHYQKMHPFTFVHEDEYYDSGTQLEVGAMDSIPVGIGICYDLRFPELFRAMVDRVHLIIVPSNWPLARIEQWKILLKARAVENQVYVLGINCVGRIAGIEYSGESTLIDPIGRVNIECEKNKETITYVEIQDDVNVYREKFPVLDDRKSNLFWNNQNK